MTTRHLKDLLNKDAGDLAKLTRRARQMADLSDAVRRALPESLQPAMHSASCTDDQTLIILTDSSAIGARFRYHTDDMLSAARRHGVRAARCKVRVRPQANAGDG
ncbi:MAG: DciA family protein [Pseudomonadota bacterium]